MTDRNIEASNRLFEMAQEGKTPEEMTAELAAMGSTLFVKPGHKFGNAILDQGVGSVELVTVEDGKVINSDGGTENDIIYFFGEVYHFAEDHVTMVPGYPEKAEAPDKLPAEVDKSRRIDMAGKTDRVQTQRGWYTRTYDEDGYCVKVVKG